MVGYNVDRNRMDRSGEYSHDMVYINFSDFAVRVAGSNSGIEALRMNLVSVDCSPWAKPFLPRVGGPVSLAIVPWGREKRLKKVQSIRAPC